MLSETLLDELRYKGEGSDLDYKAERYPFAGASDEEKGEMLKDILAFANAHRAGPAYILMGFKDIPPHPAEVVGLSADGAIDDSRVQQFVNSKLNSNLEFRYEEGMFGGRHIAVISIPQQRRPFYLKKDYGNVRKDTVYVRRGSSTGVASLDEIASMGSTRGAVKAFLEFHTAENEPLPYEFQRRFINFPEKLPNLVPDRNSFLANTVLVNKDYFRDGAAYHSSRNRVVSVRLLLSNQSEFSLGDTHLEIFVRCPDGETVSLLRADEMPDVPSSYYTPLARSHLELGGQAVEVDNRGKHPVAHVSLGTIRPGQKVAAEDDIAILPSGPGIYVIAARILANEIPTPLVEEHRFEVTGGVTFVTKEEYFETWDNFPEDDE